MRNKRRDKLNQPIHLSTAQLVTVRRGLIDLGNKWGETVTTDIVMPILEIVQTELDERSIDDAIIAEAFAQIEREYDGV